MKLTLMQALMIGAAPMLAAAQVSPRPAPAPAPKVAPAPKPPKEKPDPWFHFDDFKLLAEDMRWKADEMRVHALEMSRVDVERIRQQAEEMALLYKPDVERIRHQAEEMAMLYKPDAESVRRMAEEARHFAQIDADLVRRQAEELKHNLKFDFDFNFDGAGFGRAERFLNAQPRAPWAQEDPADSIYRVGREALNRGEYRRAAQMFAEVNKKYPRSVYALDSAYWEAFARYRTGTTEDLREALKILNEKSTAFAALRNHEGNVDVQALRTRVLGALASRGDRNAEEELKRNAQQNSGCDREEVSVKAEALGALGQMDFAAALPVVRKVLQRRDECTVELRRRALYIIARQPTAEGVGLVLDAAKNDSSSSIRGEAMRLLPRVAGDSAVPQLEELLKTTTDESTQRSIVSALNSIDSDRARRAIRTIIERNDANERLRADAISGVTRERENRSVSAEEMNYVRQLYGRVESVRLKEAVLTAVGRHPTTENQQFLVGVVRNTNEQPSLRGSALQRLGRMENVTAAEIAKLYEVADSRSMRESVVNSLANRKEPEGIDKVIEIAKKDTDPQIRRTAINAINRAAQNGNERAKKFLQEFFDR
jgi:HEAT repeat protein/TolA-binding protein